MPPLSSPPSPPFPSQAVQMDFKGHSHFHSFATCHPLPKHRQVTEDRTHLAGYFLSSLPNNSFIEFPWGCGASTSLSQAPWPGSHAPGGSRVQHRPKAREAAVWLAGAAQFLKPDPHPDKGPIQKSPKTPKWGGGGAQCSCWAFSWGVAVRAVWAHISTGSISSSGHGTGEPGPEWSGAASH